MEETHVNKGEPIPVPVGAVSVVVHDMTVKAVKVVSEKPSVFKKGIWDLELDYIFEYSLDFKNCNNRTIQSTDAFSAFNKTVSLYGGDGENSAVFTNLFPSFVSPITQGGAPFVVVEAKAISLKSELKSTRHNPSPIEVLVTIGMFNEIQLCRIAALNVDSRGAVIPKECERKDPLNPCEFFDKLDFPINDFNPPNK